MKKLFGTGQDGKSEKLPSLRRVTVGTSACEDGSIGECAEAALPGGGPRPMISPSGPMTPRSAAQAAACDSSSPKLAAHGFLKRDECRPELAQQLRVNTRKGLERLSQRQGLPQCVSPRVLGGSYTELSALGEQAAAAECACAEAGGPAGSAGQQAEEDMVPPVVMAGPGEKLPLGSGTTGTGTGTGTAGAGAGSPLARGEGLAAAEGTLRLRGGGVEGPEGQLGAYQAPQRYQAGGGIDVGRQGGYSGPDKEHGARMAEGQAVEAGKEARVLAQLSFKVEEEKHLARAKLQEASQEVKQASEDALEQLVQEGQGLRSHSGMPATTRGGAGAGKAATLPGTSAGGTSSPLRGAGSGAGSGAASAVAGAGAGAATLAELQGRAEALTVEAAELEEESKPLEARTAALVKEGQYLQDLEAARLSEVAQLQEEVAALRQEVSSLEETAMRELGEAERAVVTVEDKARQVGPAPGRALQQELRAEAEHADVLAQQAELKLGEAAQALVRLHRAQAALAKASGEAKDLHSQSVKKLEDAGGPAQAAESLMERAYEKACHAFEAKQAAQRVQQGGPAVVPLPGTPRPEEGKAGGIQQRLRGINQELESSQERANELVAEAQSHLRASQRAEREAGRLAESMGRRVPRGVPQEHRAQA